MKEFVDADGILTIESWAGRICIFKPDYVLKSQRRNFSFDIFENEIFWLQQLELLGFVPKIIDINQDPRELKLTYCGEQITADNAPDDWEKQIEHILNGLTTKNCSHNDIKPTELLVRDNKRYLIDFGWATKLDQDIPKSFPRGLGGKFKYGVRNFDDRYSMYKSLKKRNIV